MGKLMYAFRVSVTILGLALLIWLFWGGMGSFLVGLFRFSEADTFIHVKDGAIYDSDNGIFRLTFDKENGISMDGIEVIFYDEEGGSNSLIWKGETTRQTNVLFFDVSKCRDQLTDVVAIAILDGNIKSIPTRKADVVQKIVENEKIVYNLCEACLVGGEGTKSKPRVICSCNELMNISRDLGSHYVLGNNIDCGGLSFLPIGDDVRPFRGSIDGDGYSVYNLEILGGEDYSALIGVLFKGEVKNIGIVNGNVEGNLFGGGLIGRQEEGKVENSFVKDVVVSGAADVGGLIGYSNGEVTNCYSVANVTASIFGGGLIGGFAGELKNSYFVGEVNSVYNGFIGKSFDGGSVESCYYNGDKLSEVNNVIGISKSEEEMRQKGTFKEWDFENVWKIEEGVSYPELR